MHSTGSRRPVLKWFSVPLRGFLNKYATLSMVMQEMYPYYFLSDQRRKIDLFLEIPAVRKRWLLICSEAIELCSSKTCLS